MRLGVCVKQVPAGRLQLAPDNAWRLDRSGDTELNPRDRSAVEAALLLRDAGAVDEVVLLSMGVPEAEEAVREGLAMGADRGILCADPRAAGSDLLATSRVVASLAVWQRCDLVFFGQLAADSGGGVLFGAVARRLGWPVLSQVTEIELGDGLVVVGRQTEEGYERLRAPMPCVVSVTDAFEPRFPTFREMKAARDKPLDVVDLETLAVDVAGAAASKTYVRQASPPPIEARERVVFDGAEEEKDTAARLVSLLRERGALE